MDAEERHQDEGRPHRLPQADGGGVSGVAVEFGQEDADHVDEEAQAGQHGQKNWYRQDPLGVALVQPAPEPINHLSSSNIISYQANINKHLVI